MEIKASLRNSRTGAKGNLCMAGHNDRTKGGWNYPEKTEQNGYWVMEKKLVNLKDSSFNSFEEMERAFYDKHFQKHLDLQNEKHMKAGNTSRIKKDKDGNALPASEVYLKDKKKAPMETILQVGDKNTDIDERTRKNLTVRAFSKYASHLNAISDGSYKMLNVAMHMDEETPHLHIRGVFVAKDKNGHEELAQKEAIKGIKANHPEIFENAREPAKKKGDKDLIAWTDYQREVWYDAIERTAKEMNLDIHINREVQHPGALHLEPMQYKLQRLQSDLCDLSFDLEQTKEELTLTETCHKKVQSAIDAKENQLNEIRAEVDAKATELENTTKELKRAETELGGVRALTKKRCEELVQAEYKKNFRGDCYLVPKEDLQEMQDAVRELESCKVLERRAGKAEQKRTKALEDAERIREGATLEEAVERAQMKTRIEALESQNKRLKKAIKDYLPSRDSNRILGEIEGRKTRQRDDWEHDR